MTALSITATQVQPGTDASVVFRQGIAGATITAGQAVYLDATTDTYKLADSDLSAAGAAAVGIALNGAAAGQPLRIQCAGDITIGAAATMTVGVIYVLSSTAGGIAPAADIVAGVRVTLLGVASSASVLRMALFASGVAAA